MQDDKGDTVLRAQGLELSTRAATVFRDIDITICSGEVVALRGRNGSGKTALLLCLAGRMKYSGGKLEVDGFYLPRYRHRVQCRVGLSLFKKVNDLQENLSVLHVMRAEGALRARKHTTTDALDYLCQWNLDTLAYTPVKSLTSEHLAQLGIALAFVGSPRLVVVDDIEDQLTMDQSIRLMNMLISRAREHRVAIVVGVVERELARMADQTVFLSKEGA